MSRKSAIAKSKATTANLFDYDLYLKSCSVNALKCPCCGAIGTFNLHSPSSDNRPWRMLCKYCGFYVGPEGRGLLCYPSRSQKCWCFKVDAKRYKDKDLRTPAEVVHQEMNGQVWPWRT